MIYNNLNPQKALIWRIVHRDNVPWMLLNGLHCSNSSIKDPGYVPIGNPDLIDKRRHRAVPISPNGTLADYVPFYFTPFSVMLLNIKTGRGVKQRNNDEIVIMVSSVSHAANNGSRVIFTDAHAFPAWTSYYSDPAELVKIDWPLLQRRDFKRDPDDLRKIERCQAEALVYQHLPATSLLGVVTYSDNQQRQIESMVRAAGRSIPVYVRPDWYF